MNAFCKIFMDPCVEMAGIVHEIAHLDVQEFTRYSVLEALCHVDYEISVYQGCTLAKHAPGGFRLVTLSVTVWKKSM